MIKKILPALVLSAALAGSAHAEDVFPTYKAAVNAGVRFPDAHKAKRASGAFVPPANVLRIVPGLTKTQVYTLLDVPHFGEGLFGERVWNYVLNFYTGEGDNFAACQYQVHFNHSARVESAYWRDQSCADLVARLVAPKVVTQQVVTQQIDEGPPVPVGREEFYFAHNRSEIASGDYEKINAIAQKLGAGQLRTVTVVGMTDTTGERAYNDALAIRRADTVANAIRMAMPPGSAGTVSVSTSGSRDLAVPTPPGVREQANRKVVVLFMK